MNDHKRLSDQLQLGDYDFDLSIGEKDAKEDAQIAEKIVNAIV